MSYFESRHLLLAAILCVSVLPVAQGAEPWKLDQMIGRDPQGRPVYRGLPVPEAVRNPTSAEEEAAFQDRARHVIAAQGTLKVAAGNTYFENEKRTYGLLMAQFLAGRPGAIADLQLEDAQATQWHSKTEGIDFYPCFTLKHQVRKFFYFGELLAPEYRQRMLAGARAWTELDPMKRPHPKFEKPGQGWGPDARNSWVDVRTTENLYLMRVSSVYLFAEAAGSAQVAAQYKQEIRKYVTTLYRAGMGEWDSENYHGHSIAPLVNLYDFAQDEDVRRWAKAALDWVFAAGAVKYYRGGFNGPSKRDYNHAQPFGGSAANMLWLHFADTPHLKKDEWESDEVHLITSAYRPPPAVVALARKQFTRPCEILASKPHYSATTTGDSASPPEYLETHYFGNSFQMGSLTGGTSTDGGDVNGFKILCYSSQRGANALQVAPGPDPSFVGSPMYQKGKSSGPNRVAQLENTALWLVQNGKSPWIWVIPNEIRFETAGDIAYLIADRTWVAIRGLGTSPLAIDEELTRQIAEGEKPRFAAHRVLRAVGSSERYCGLAIEVGERESYGSLEEFKKHCAAAELDLSKLQEGIVQYKSATRQLGLHWNDQPKELGVWRNGARHDAKIHASLLYGPAAADRPSPIESPRGSGTLRVEAGGQRFTSTVAEDGATTFANTPSKTDPR